MLALFATINISITGVKIIICIEGTDMQAANLAQTGFPLTNALGENLPSPL